ncbi:MAG: hypothetical protein COA79_03555 [Planctomycetota bacterium]|nr:MAG: hypothetical protein COA79_03555 [Planctomycetota bacterium]
MSLIQIKNLTKSYGDRTILDKINLNINEHDRIGVVGLNGTGKSTLFKLIIDEIEADSGTITRKAETSIGILHQEPQLNDKLSAIDTVEDSLFEIKKAHKNLEVINQQLINNENKNLLAQQAEIHYFLDQVNGWEYKHLVKEVLSKLQIKDPNAIVGTLSMGMKKRVALAQLLIKKPEFILLDEPTNHLDTESIDWLEKWLKQYKGTFLFVTHDRYFLDRLANKIIEVDLQQLYSHNGNYASYLESKDVREQNDQKRSKKLEKMIKIEIEFLRKGVKARGTKPRFRENKAEQLIDEQEGISFNKEIQINMNASQSFNNIILEINNLSGGYEKALFKNLDFNLMPNSIVGIIGQNGIGKTTLLKIINEELAPLEGEVKKGKKTSIGYFSQNFENLDQELSVMKNTNGGLEYYVRNKQKFRVDQLLESFLFQSKDFGKKVKDLSGGEKARVSLASLIAKGSNLLLFDEPTNNLDLPTLQALETVLLNFDGSAVIVTHDRYFLDKIADQIIYFKDGTAKVYKGNYAQYLLNIDQTKKQEIKAQQLNEIKEKPKSKNKNATNKERSEFKTLEKRIEELEELLPALEQQLQSPETYQNQILAKELSTKLSDYNKELEQSMERWSELADLF